MKLLKINFFQLVFLALIIGYLGAQRVHETGHWFFLQLFQRGPNIGFLGLIQFWSTQPSNLVGWSSYSDPIGGGQGWLWLNSLPQSNFEWIGFFMIGQVFQIIIILLGLFLIYQTKNIIVKNVAFVVVILNSFSQLVYQSIKFINVIGGDEYFAAHYMGLSPRMITGPLTAFYGITLILILYQSNRWKERFKYIAAAVFSLAIGPILGLLDALIRQQAMLNNSFVQPIFGFSIPVLIVDIIVIFAFWFLVKNIHNLSLAG